MFRVEPKYPNDYTDTKIVQNATDMLLTDFSIYSTIPKWTSGRRSLVTDFQALDATVPNKGPDHTRQLNRWNVYSFCSPDQVSEKKHTVSFRMGYPTNFVEPNNTPDQNILSDFFDGPRILIPWSYTFGITTGKEAIPILRYTSNNGTHFAVDLLNSGGAQVFSAEHGKVAHVERFQKFKTGDVPESGGSLSKTVSDLIQAKATALGFAKGEWVALVTGFTGGLDDNILGVHRIINHGKITSNSRERRGLSQTTTPLRN